MSETRHKLERPGEELDNGFTLVAASEIIPGGLGTVDIRIVLATDGTQYAVWMQRAGDGSCHNGDYVQDFKSAVERYEKRVAREQRDD